MKSHEPSYATLQNRVDELEIRALFLEDTVDALNQQVADLNREFALAKQALQMLNQRLEHLHSHQGEVKDLVDEAPPPHY